MQTTWSSGKFSIVYGRSLLICLLLWEYIVEGKIFSLDFFLCPGLNVLPHLFNLLLKVTYSYMDIKKKKKSPCPDFMITYGGMEGLSSHFFFLLTTGLTKKGLLPFWKGLQGLSTKGEIEEKKANWNCYLLVCHKRC